MVRIALAPLFLGLTFRRITFSSGNVCSEDGGAKPAATVDHSKAFEKPEPSPPGSVVTQLGNLDVGKRREFWVPKVCAKIERRRARPSRRVRVLRFDIPAPRHRISKVPLQHLPRSEKLRLACSTRERRFAGRRA